MSWLHRIIYDAAYPDYACEQCVGQDYWQGCECSYHGGVAPGEGPQTYHLWLRKLWTIIANRGGYYDPAR